MAPDWTEIEAAPGFAGLRACVERDVIPAFRALPAEPVDKSGESKIAGQVLGQALALFIAGFFGLLFILPDTILGGLINFVLFVPMFVGSLGLVAWIHRERLTAMLLRSKDRFVARADAWRAIAGHVGVTYVPAPGGAPKNLHLLLRLPMIPASLKDAGDLLDRHGGMDAPLKVAREAGMTTQPNVSVLGTPEQKARLYAQMEGAEKPEDGFHGTRSGVTFDLFEWEQSVDDAPDIHHLVIVLKAPFRLNGLTQLRARKTHWPHDRTGARMQDVDLGPRAFEAAYRLRSTDQVEARTLFNPAVIERVIALSAGEPFRAVATGDHLVFAVSGKDRFEIMAPSTGAWSEESLKRGIGDLVTALALVEALAHAFMLARTP